MSTGMSLEGHEIDPVVLEMLNDMSPQEWIDEVFDYYDKRKCVYFCQHFIDGSGWAPRFWEWAFDEFRQRGWTINLNEQAMIWSVHKPKIELKVE